MIAVSAEWDEFQIIDEIAEHCFKDNLANQLDLDAIVEKEVHDLEQQTTNEHLRLAIDSVPGKLEKLVSDHGMGYDVDLDHDDGNDAHTAVDQDVAADNEYGEFSDCGRQEEYRDTDRRDYSAQCRYEERR